MIAAWLEVLQDHVLDMRVNIEARRPQATYEHLVAARGSSICGPSSR
jgi:hypothetical protein